MANLFQVALPCFVPGPNDSCRKTQNATLSSGFLSAAPESFDMSKLNRRHSGRRVLANLPTWSPASWRGLHLPAGAASINKNVGARKSSELNSGRSEKFLERMPRILSSSPRLSSSLCSYTSAKMWLEEHHQEPRSKHHRRREPALSRRFNCSHCIQDAASKLEEVEGFDSIYVRHSDFIKECLI